jgi:hypothetical protein
LLWYSKIYTFALLAAEVIYHLTNSLKSKITTKTFNFHTVHTFKSFECELCKKPLAERIQVKNEIVNLIDYNRPDGNYLMLETFTKDKTETKYLYLIHFNDKTTLRLGRSNESDVRLSDISISRNHATLKVVNDSIYLDDCNSKFGTLTQTCNKLTVIPGKPLSLQIGRFYYNFTMRRTFWAFLSCYE